jgi:hypothetical protein
VREVWNSEKVAAISENSFSGVVRNVNIGFHCANGYEWILGWEGVNGREGYEMGRTWGQEPGKATESTFTV